MRRSNTANHIKRIRSISRLAFYEHGGDAEQNKSGTAPPGKSAKKKRSKTQKIIHFEHQHVDTTVDKETAEKEFELLSKVYPWGCTACGQQNEKGVLHCINCGHLRPPLEQKEADHVDEDGDVRDLFEATEQHAQAATLNTESIFRLIGPAFLKAVLQSSEIESDGITAITHVASVQHLMRPRTSVIVAWERGYRILQIFFSSLRDHLWGARYGDSIPSVLEIQRTIESAWRFGFDREWGQKNAFQMEGTRKLMGEREITTFLRSLGIPTFAIRFGDVNKACGYHAAVGWFCDDYFQHGPKKALGRILSAGEDSRFEENGVGKEAAPAIVRTAYPPLLLHCEAFDVLILGVQRERKLYRGRHIHRTTLLVLDPRMNGTMKVLVSSLRRCDYAILFADAMEGDLKEGLSKDICGGTYTYSDCL